MQLQNNLKILFLGDIYGKPGRSIVEKWLPGFILKEKIDFVIANGENLAHGRGITKKTSQQLFKVGVDVFTGGNHLWDRRNGLDFLIKEKRIIKPANYPKPAYGNDFYEIIMKGKKIIVANLCGNVFMDSPSSPFETAKEFMKKDFDIFILDFHAEATAEKKSMAFLLDGKATAVIGTHTHVQTSDETILPEGTAYITDAGMCGGHDSVIGVKKNIILKKIKSGMPVRYDCSHSGLEINGVLLDIDSYSNVKKISRVKEKISL